MSPFAEFVVSHLPPAPARVLEVGCGRDGGLVEVLTANGYDTLGVDPEAPAGERFDARRFEDARDRLAAERWDAVVAGRVLHHVERLDEGLDLLATLAPLLLVDEFAWDRIDEPTKRWYGERRQQPDAGGPEDLDEWRWRHPGLHPHGRVLAALRARYAELALERVPYLHRWLGERFQRDEEEAVAAGSIPPIGYRWAGAAY